MANLWLTRRVRLYVFASRRRAVKRGARGQVFIWSFHMRAIISPKRLAGAVCGLTIRRQGRNVWASGVHILVNPSRIDAPDIEKIVVQRNGNLVAATRATLAPHELATATGAKRMIHSGDVIYPLSAFEPGLDVSVTVIAIPASGSNITRTFDALERYFHDWGLLLAFKTEIESA